MNIAPSKFGNISRFVCGINNFDRSQKKIVNVKAVRFSYKGKMRIIFVAKKNIEKGTGLDVVQHAQKKPLGFQDLLVHFNGKNYIIISLTS